MRLKKRKALPMVTRAMRLALTLMKPIRTQQVTKENELSNEESSTSSDKNSSDNDNKHMAPMAEAGASVDKASIDINVDEQS